MLSKIPSPLVRRLRVVLRSCDFCLESTQLTSSFVCPKGACIVIVPGCYGVSPWCGARLDGDDEREDFWLILKQETGL